MLTHVRRGGFGVRTVRGAGQALGQTWQARLGGRGNSIARDTTEGVPTAPRSACKGRARGDLDPAGQRSLANPERGVPTGASCNAGPGAGGAVPAAATGDARHRRRERRRLLQPTGRGWSTRGGTVRCWSSKCFHEGIVNARESACGEPWGRTRVGRSWPKRIAGPSSHAPTARTVTGKKAGRSLCTERCTACVKRAR